MHVQFGEYHVGDVEFVAAFDVDEKKVGLDLADAIWASENNTIKFADVPPLGVTVQRGPTLDGLGPSGDCDHCSERSADGSKVPEYVLPGSFVPKAELNIRALQGLLAS